MAKPTDKVDVKNYNRGGRVIAPYKREKPMRFPKGERAEKPGIGKKDC